MRGLWDSILAFTLNMEWYYSKNGFGLCSALLSQDKMFVERRQKSTMNKLFVFVNRYRGNRWNISANILAYLIKI